MNLNAKLEKAIAAYLETDANVTDPLEAASGDVLTGMGEVIKTKVALVVVAGDGQEEPVYSGNFDVPVEVQLHWAADTDTLDDANALAGAVEAALWVQELAASIQTNGSSLVVNGVHSRASDMNREEDSWIYVWSLTVSCRNS